MKIKSSMASLFCSSICFPKGCSMNLCRHRLKPAFSFLAVVQQPFKRGRSDSWKKNIHIDIDKKISGILLLPVFHRPTVVSLSQNSIVGIVVHLGIPPPQAHMSYLVTYELFETLMYCNKPPPKPAIPWTSMIMGHMWRDREALMAALGSPFLLL